MPCFHPLDAYRGPDENGAVKIAFGERLPSERWEPLLLPCGRCIGCRLEYSRQWAMRITHEKSLYVDNCFLTLTYDDVHLPEDGSLDKRAFPGFMKRLRKVSGAGVRYFHAGEYGSLTNRPHYHAILFNWNFPDREYLTTRGEYPVYTSALLQKLWPFGLSEVGDVTFESAAYVARYICSKVTGPIAEKYYDGLQPEFATMSRRPGIGQGWYEKFKDEVYPYDEVIMRGKAMKPPRYYDKKLDFEELEAVRETREASRRREDESIPRLMSREACAKARVALNRRSV